MSFTKFLGNIGLFARNHAPEILVTSGIVTGVAAAIFVGRGTPKAIDAKNQLDKNIEICKSAKENGVIVLDGEEQDYTDEDYKKDLALTYVQGAWGIVKPYLPAIGLGATSIVCILSGVGILKKRNAALASIASSTAAAFANYRNQVINDLGEQKDREYYYGEKTEEVKKKVVDPETGKKVTEVTNISYIDPTVSCGPLLGPYSIRLDMNNPSFRACNGEPIYLETWLRQQQTNATNQLHKWGHLYLSDLLKDYLNVSPDTYINLDTDAVQVLGWLDDAGDGFVDFGCWGANGELQLVRGIDGEVYLDFNCMPILGRTKPKTSDEKRDAWHRYPEIEK